MPKSSHITHLSVQSLTSLMNRLVDGLVILLDDVHAVWDSGLSDVLDEVLLKFLKLVEYNLNISWA